ncbi:copine family protein [Stylonychia lemnae]|uniref:Copine family protein n=1 Tax=Stylonychia lemnae TaxID=5949 RepID=A0A078AD86_STYLE|nr:copine family protein [Stylonychia lemnae]|eukprot:CDW80204.1 copine family protein [Stylonychia lemnae]
MLSSVKEIVSQNDIELNMGSLESQSGLNCLVDLYISCRNLQNIDKLSKPDPQCIVYYKKRTLEEWRILGQTEIVKDSLNPDFQKKIKLSYKFEKHQYLKIEVLDYDKQGKFEEIGYSEMTLGKIIGSKEMQYESDIKKDGQSNSKGKLISRIAPYSETTWSLNMQFKVQNLPATAKCFCFKIAYPEVEIFRVVEDSQNQKKFFSVYKSEASTTKTTSPNFKPIKLAGALLCNSNENQPIRFLFRDKFHEDKEQFGEIEANITQLKNQKSFPILNGQAQINGEMIINHIQIQRKAQFLDYINNGWELNFVVAIDYTGSNGDPSMRSSLHTKSEFNQYQKAIFSIGSIIENYDSDKRYLVYGFGGVLNQMEKIVNKKKSQKIYNILLIITDGLINDFTEVRTKIVQMSSQPLSIIIIGVGEQNFESMKELDGDENVLLGLDGRPGVRDIVQFVEFNKFKNNEQALAAEVLKEIPEQLVNYMDYKNVKIN